MNAHTFSEAETENIAVEWGRSLVAGRNRPLVIGLTGELGAGKSVFVRAFLRGLGVTGVIPSPTFVIYRRYPIASHDYFTQLYHFDLYRLSQKEAARELERLEWADVVSGPHIILLEWAERAEGILPDDAVWVTIKHGEKPEERFLQLKKD